MRGSPSPTPSHVEKCRIRFWYWRAGEQYIWASAHKRIYREVVVRGIILYGKADNNGTWRMSLYHDERWKIVEHKYMRLNIAEWLLFSNFSRVYTYKKKRRAWLPCAPISNVLAYIVYRVVDRLFVIRHTIRLQDEDVQRCYRGVGCGFYTLWGVIAERCMVIGRLAASILTTRELQITRKLKPPTHTAHIHVWATAAFPFVRGEGGGVAKYFISWRISTSLSLSAYIPFHSHDTAGAHRARGDSF